MNDSYAFIGHNFLKKALSITNINNSICATFNYPTMCVMSFKKILFISRLTLGHLANIS